MKLNILHLTDIHGKGSLLHNIGDELEKTDLIILSGDITHFGRKKEIRQIIEILHNYNKNILTVPGNCDHREVDEFLTAAKINLHLRHELRGQFTLCGLGGSLPCPGYTPNEFTEFEVNEWLSVLQKKVKIIKPIIFVSHQPPYNTINDRLLNGYNVGSRPVREFIENVSPLLCLTGHIHEGIGIDTIGNCKVVNPGPFRNGYYALISITGENSI